MNIVSYHIPSNPVDNIILRHNGNTASGNTLQFMMQDANSNTIASFRHLDYDVAGLLKLLKLSSTQLIKLFETKQLYLSPYTLEYVPRKYFSIRYGFGRGAPFINLSNMHQYLHYDLTEEQPGKTAFEVANEVYSILQDIGLDVNSLVSPIRAWEREVLSDLDLPNSDDIPTQASEFAYKCTHGGWVESFRKGHWPEAFDYDIKSAYGKFTRELLDTRQGKWINSKEYQPDAYYGYCDVTVEITAKFSPIMYDKSSEQQFTPTGTWDTFLTKAEIDFIRDYKLGKIDISNGWWWIPNTELIYPLESMIDWLYDEKEKRTGLAREVIKRIMSGIWGKFLEIRKDKEGNQRQGDFFNPVWGAEVESRTRLAVAKFVLDNNLEDDLLHIAVDGVVSSRPVKLGNNSSIGDWKLSTTGACFVISSGVVAIENKNGIGDFALKYDWLMDKILDKPDNIEYIMSKPSIITLGIARKTNRLDMIGQMEDVTKVVDVEYEMKRNYPEYPVNGRELLKNKYKSIPWDISVICSK